MIKTTRFLSIPPIILLWVFPAFLNPLNLFMLMLFGMQNVLLHFHRAMKTISGDLVGIYTLVYLDDILIYSVMAVDHIKYIKAFFR